MRRFIAFILSLLFLCSILVACKDEKTASDEKPDSCLPSIVRVVCNGPYGVPNRFISGFLVGDGRTVYTHYSALIDSLELSVYS